MFTPDGLTQAMTDRGTLETAASQADRTYPTQPGVSATLTHSLARLVGMGLMTPAHVVTDAGMARLAPPRELPLIATPPVITCSWCDQPATRVTDPHNGEPMCLPCARNDHGTTREALANTYALGKRAYAMLAARNV